MTTVIYKPENCYPQQGPRSKIRFDRLTLDPGTNHLSEAQFSTLAAHPDFKAYVNRKALIIQEPKEEVELVPLSDIPANLSAYNLTEAGDIIDNTHDVDVLKRWLKDENRKGARDQITLRIKNLGGNV